MIILVLTSVYLSWEINTYWSKNIPNLYCGD